MQLEEYKSYVGQVPFGKRLPGAVYVLRGEGVGFGEALDSLLKRLEAKYEISPQFNVIKFRTDELKVSFLAYPGLLSDAHPALRHAITIDLVSGKARHRSMLRISTRQSFIGRRALSRRTIPGGVNSRR